MKHLKNFLTTIAVLLCSVTVSAYDFEVDGLYYNLISASEKSCELVGCQSEMSNLIIPASVTIRGVKLKVNSIKESAFRDNANIKKVSFVNSLVTKVSDRAFYGCKNLRQVELSNVIETIGHAAFCKCPIDTMVIPANVKKVSYNGLSEVKNIEIANSNDSITFSNKIETLTSAFIGRNVSYPFFANTSISKVTFGTGITKIYPKMFEACKQIKEISIPANIVEIGDNAFNGCDSLEKFIIEDCEKVLSLGKNTVLTDRREYSSGGIYVEYNCTNRGLLTSNPIKELYIGRNISYPISSKYIGKTYDGYEWSQHWQQDAIRILLRRNDMGSPFDNSKIESVVIGEKVTKLGDLLFYGNTNIVTFKIPDNCKELGGACFGNCEKLQTIDLNNCYRIGGSAFAYCSALRNVNLSKVKIIGEYAFQGVEIESIDLTNVDSVLTGAFDSCDKFKHVEITDNVKEIQSRAFRNCANLHMVTVGEGISVLPEQCFADCENLRWILLGSNLQEIRNGAFENCEQIKTIGIKNVNPPLFTNINELGSVNKFDATLYIPQGTTFAYENSEVWKDFLFKQESDIAEYVYTLPKVEESDNSKKLVVAGDLTGAVINQINANSVVEDLNLQATSIVIDNQNPYYRSGKRVDSHWDDIDVVRGAPYYSYIYYTAATASTDEKKEYNNSGKLINVITTCYSSDLTNAYLSEKLKSIKLPSSLTKLGDNAIQGSNLLDLYVYSTVPPTASSKSFGNTNKSKCILHVPEGCKEAYAKASGWNDFYNIVEDVSENYIEVQPTNENRKVKLARKDENATYQWYKYVNKTDNVIDITNFFSSSTGWDIIGGCWQSNIHKANTEALLSYEHTFNVGDVLSFDWVVSCENTFDQLQLYLGDELIFVKSGELNGSFEKTFESSATGKLTFVYVKDNNIDVANDNVKISNVRVASLHEQTLEGPVIIEGEVSNELTMGAAAVGDNVFCVVTLGDGRQIKSNEIVLEYVNYIKTQPTADNLYVELDTHEEGVKYQWHQCMDTVMAYKNIIPVSSGLYPWTESNGVWTSGNKGVNSSSSIMIATVQGQAGDVIDYDAVISCGTGDVFYVRVDGKTIKEETGTSRPITWMTFRKDATITLEFEYRKDDSEHGNNDCVTISDLRISRNGGFVETEDIEIVGATSATLSDSMYIKGSKVYCIITLPNGRVLVSDMVTTSKEDTSIESVIMGPETYRVYNIYGNLVLNTPNKTDLNHLTQGIYIVNGKKFIVK